MGMTIAPDVLQIAQELEPGANVEMTLRQILESEIRRRLAKYEWADRALQRKYNMTLAEFEASGAVEKLGYSFEAESDHQEWDQAIDGIETMRAMLRRLTGNGDSKSL